jgi:Mrp family chromosome partitioning ATPase
MPRRRGRPPVLARISDPAEGTGRAGSLNRSQLEAFGEISEAVGDAGAVLATGDEGKSALALGLSTVATAKGRRTALVECDLAVPTLAERLGLARTPGLHEYLLGGAEAAQLLQPVVLSGPASAGAGAPLVCVTAGAATADGPDLLSSEGFGHAIERLRHAYDLLVLDGPPLGSGYSLSKVAAVADATLACLDRPLPARRLPVPVRGLVIRS